MTGDVKRVCLLGAESTGKTTLAAALAERFDTVWNPEYGRPYTQLGRPTHGLVRGLDLLQEDVARLEVAVKHAALVGVVHGVGQGGDEARGEAAVHW